MAERAKNSMDHIVEGGKDGGSTTDRFWEEARDIFYQDLGQAKSARLDDTTRLGDTIKSLKLTQSKVSDEYRTHTLRVGSKDIDIKVGRIMRRLELMLQVGDAAMQFGPETVSLVWSAFRMVFTVCLSPVLHPPRVVDQIHRLGFSQGFATLRFLVRCRGPDFRHIVCMPGVCQTVFQGESSDG